MRPPQWGAYRPGLAFPNCYLRPSIAYLFRYRKDGMLMIFLFVGLHSRIATLLVCTALCYFTCKKQHRTLPKFWFRISRPGTNRYRHSEINDSWATSLTRPLTNNFAKSEISQTVLEFSFVTNFQKDLFSKSWGICAYILSNSVLRGARLV